MSTSQSKCKQTWFPWWFVPNDTIQYLHTQSTVLANSSALVESVLNREWKWQTQHYCCIKFFLFYMTVGVIEWRSGSYASSGLCAGFPITGLRFQLPLIIFHWHKVSVMRRKTCDIIQLKYVLPKLCHLPQYSYGSWDPIKTQTSEDS